MKTKLIITIIIGLVISSGFAFIYNEMYDCLNPPGWLKMPRTFSFSDCLEQFANGNLPHYTRDSDTASKEIIQIIQVIKPGDETLENFEGVIIDQRLGPDHWYHFFTNDHFKTFNTGSIGITLEGINTIDNLHGAIVNISGIRNDRDLGIQVYELHIFDSVIPSSTTGNVSNMKSILNVYLDTLYEDPDSYYNRFIRITGELREHEREIRYAGHGCDIAKYTTSDEFMPDGPSSRQLFVGEKFIGIRIDDHNDVGKVENELISELKNKQVEIMGIFVPHIVDRGGCDHVIHKSGYILTKLDDIKISSEDVPVESEVIEERFHDLTKSQIIDIQQAELGCKKIGNQTYCDISIQEKIDYYLQQNQGELENEKSTSLDIASIEDGRIKLNPVDTCAGIDIDRLTLDELNQRYPATFTTKSGKTYEIKFLSINDDDLKEMPIISELIRATHQIPFPLNGGITASKGLVENPDWNDYREWYDQKKTEQFNLDEVRVRGFVYHEEYYGIGFSIC